MGTICNNGFADTAIISRITNSSHGVQGVTRHAGPRLAHLFNSPSDRPLSPLSSAAQGKGRGGARHMCRGLFPIVLPPRQALEGAGHSVSARPPRAIAVKCCSKLHEMVESQEIWRAAIFCWAFICAGGRARQLLVVLMQLRLSAVRECNSRVGRLCSWFAGCRICLRWRPGRESGGIWARHCSALPKHGGARQRFCGWRPTTG